MDLHPSDGTLAGLKKDLLKPQIVAEERSDHQAPANIIEIDPKWENGWIEVAGELSDSVL